MSARLVSAVLLLAALAAPLYSMDSLNMPTANAMNPGNTEVNFIYINQPTKLDKAGNVKMDDMRYLKVFSGVTDRLQLDVCHLDIKDAGNHTILNGYYTVVEETPEHPSLVLGATNLMGEDWLGGAEFGGDPGNDDASVFAVAGLNLSRPGKPTPRTPLIRLNLGYGDKFHGEKLFGGVWVKVDPRFGAMAQTYKSMPTYAATWQATDKLQLTAGTMDGNTFYRVGGLLTW